ncbi:MAG TPA: sulfatase-like hydrolase/transferase [Steroidobacteraceae bacterium]|jgi:arylsulfatase A-like enzyme|nr:sulfatase-like hydrolase/transferase [Steroidobacteraceae bacterium]
MAPAGERRDAGNGDPASAWRTAALPALALLGVVLPLVFVPQLEDFLYYFRPSDLLPAYGTAWLLLAVLAVPAWLILALVLKGLGAVRGPRGAHALPALHALLGAAVVAAAAIAAAGAALYCLLVWLQTFGLLSGVSFRTQLVWAAVAIGVLIAATPRGRALVRRCAVPVAWCVAFGALAAISVPFFGWRSGAGAPAPAPTLAGVQADPRPGTSGQPLPVAGGPLPAAQRRPHIVLLTIDALSAEHMSLYGAARPTTPMLSAFAAGATTFQRTYANGNFTTPGIASILTGTRPWTHRALQLPSWPEDATRRESLPAVLQRGGYQTGYVSTNAAAGAAKNGLGSYFGFASRDRIQDLNLCTDSLSALLKYACPVAAMPLFAELLTLAAAVHGQPGSGHYDPRLATGPALAWLQSVDKSRPVFLWVHLYPPHSPYAAPTPWLGRFDASGAARSLADTEPHWAYAMGEVSPALAQTLTDRYDESVRYVDHYAGAFLQRALQLLGPDTVVVVTADHGESFRHGYGAHTGPGLYDEIIHVPLIVKLPEQTQGGRCDALSEQADIAPTLAQLAGIAPPPLWEGHSLLGACAASASDPLPAGSAPGYDTPVFSMNFEQNRRHAALTTGSVAVIEGRWKLVHYLGRPHYPQMPPLHDTLYDLAADPRETVNQAAAQPAEVTRLRRLIDAQLARHGGAQ